MKNTINISCHDDFDTIHEITVRHTGTLPDYYMRNVIDLASIVGHHNVARGAVISDIEPLDYIAPGLPLFEYLGQPLY